MANETGDSLVNHWWNSSFYTIAQNCFTEGLNIYANFSVVNSLVVRSMTRILYRSGFSHMFLRSWEEEKREKKKKHSLPLRCKLGQCVFLQIFDDFFCSVDV